MGQGTSHSAFQAKHRVPPNIPDYTVVCSILNCLCHQEKPCQGVGHWSAAKHVTQVYKLYKSSRVTESLRTKDTKNWAWILNLLPLIIIK